MAPRDPNEWLNRSMYDFVMQPTQLPGYALPNDTVDDLGGWMTDINKGSNLTTDLDFLLANPGMVDPRAFNPVTTQEVVEAPGYQRLQSWYGGPNAFEDFVAKMIIDNNADQGMIMTQLQGIPEKAAAGDEQAIAVMQSMPPQIIRDPVTGLETVDPDGTPDVRGAGYRVQELFDQMASDPVYDRGEDGRAITDEMGRPVMQTTEDSALTQAAQEAGYYSDPSATYDPYMFAREGVTPETDIQANQEALAAMMKWQEAQQKQDLWKRGNTNVDALVTQNATRLEGDLMDSLLSPPSLDGQVDRPANRQMTDGVEQAMMRFSLPEADRPSRGMMSINRSGSDSPNFISEGGPTKARSADPLAMMKANLFGDPAGPSRGMGSLAASSPPSDEMITEGGPTRSRMRWTDPEGPDRSRKSTPRPTPMSAGTREVSKRRGQANLGAAQGRRQAAMASARDTQAQYEAMLRMQLARDLQAQGRSPFYDEVAMRNRGVYGR